MLKVSLDYRPAASEPDSGIGRQNIALALGLRQCSRVSELRLVTTAPQGHPLRQQADCPPWSIEGLKGMHRLRQRLQFEAGFLPGYLRRQSIDLHVCNFNMGLPLCRRGGRTRFILQLHDLFQLTERNQHGSRLRQVAYRCTDRLSIHYSLWRADQVWVPSQFTAGEARRLFPQFAGKVRVLPPMVLGYELQGEAESLPELPERYWLVVGTREPRKNIAQLLRAWRDARQRSAQVPDLLLVGDVAQLPGELTNQVGVHVLQRLDNANLFALYRRAERLWQPSYAEGFGLPVIEALQAGTPVAVARGSSLDEVAPPQMPRFPPHDQQALTQLMLELAREGKGDPAPLLAWAERYNMARFVARLNDLIEELVP